MAEKGLRNIIMTVVLIFIVISVGALVFVVVYIPSREGGAGVKIAILDSGLNMNVRIAGYNVGRELKDSVVNEKSFVTTEYGYSKNESVIDNTEYNHGTLVAMQIASRSIGIAPEAKLIIARCADAEGTATFPSILAAFNWAVEEADADIVNISIGGPIIENNSIVEAINNATYKYGVLTVISSGNSGDVTGYSTSSIETPGDALQAITVGANTYEGVAEYSSIGPLKDHRVKPDLLDSGFTLIALGTSFSAPKVAAKAAVLLSWCRTQGYKTSPGLLKAALMASAAFEQPYPIYYTGAGVADVEEAKTIITQAQKINSWPLVYYVLPNQLPFSMPNAFRGDIWNFPLSIISPFSQEFSFTSNLSLSQSIVSIPTTAQLNQTSEINCKFIIPIGHPIGIHSEKITIEDAYGNTFNLNIRVNIETPLAKIAFDVYHSTWEIDSLFGQFRELRLKLADEKVSLVELDTIDNFSQLNNFDALIIPDPNTFSVYLDENMNDHIFYKKFSNDTINSIVDYINTGHGLFILGTTNDSAALNETNRLLNHFNITINNSTIPSPLVYNPNTGSYNIIRITEMNSSHPVTTNIIDFDYIGSSLSIIGNNSQGIAWYKNPSNIAIAVFENKTSEGRVIVSGSNFMADNWGINAKYNSTHNLEFIMSVIEWITKKDFTPTLSNQLDINQITSKPISRQLFVTTPSLNNIQNNGLQITYLDQAFLPNWQTSTLITKKESV